MAVAAAALASPHTVFVVDDDPLVLASLGRLLELETPHRIRAFSSSAEALEALEAERPDLLISDLTMPGLDGLELLRRARIRHPDCARIVLTGYADKESAIRAINDAAIYQYVEKPWDNAQLLATVQNALDYVTLSRRLRATITELEQRNAELERTIRELKDAQDRLVASERLAAVGRLASGIAHEIGNQLSLLGYAELLADRYADDPEAHEMTMPILAARRRLSSMVMSIKEFARGGRGRYPRERQTVAPAIEEAMEILRFDSAFRFRTVVREPDDHEAEAVVNREKLLQVVLNLLRNSLQATSEGGRIRVGLERQPQAVVITVEDDGVGIPPDNLPHIWDVFFSTKGDAGTGLGLGICKRIVEEHGGTIGVTSTVGEGTTFTVTLPAGQPPSGA